MDRASVMMCLSRSGEGSGRLSYMTNTWLKDIQKRTTLFLHPEWSLLRTYVWQDRPVAKMGKTARNWAGCQERRACHRLSSVRSRGGAVLENASRHTYAVQPKKRFIQPKYHNCSKPAACLESQQHVKGHGERAQTGEILHLLRQTQWQCDQQRHRNQNHGPQFRRFLQTNLSITITAHKYDIQTRKLK